MSSNGPVYQIKSRDGAVTVELAFDTQTVSLQHSDGAGTALTFKAPLKDAPQHAVNAGFASLQAAASGTQRDEHRLRLEQLGERAGYPAQYFTARLAAVARWLIGSGETTNYTYALAPRSKTYLAHTISVATGASFEAIAGFIVEAESDQTLTAHILAARDTLSRELRAVSDPAVHFGRRLGWYATVRALKPRLVVETGVDKGLGGVLLCAALLRNRAEGHPGHYVGTDINPSAGYLLSGPYRDVGEIAYGDSLQSLAKLQAPLDLFINDSDHSAAYEAREYEAVRHLLSERAVILSDNAHVTSALSDFTLAHGFKFLFWREQPIEHWYQGAGIGFGFR